MAEAVDRATRVEVRMRVVEYIVVSLGLGSGWDGKTVEEMNVDCVVGWIDMVESVGFYRGLSWTIGTWGQALVFAFCL